MVSAASFGISRPCSALVVLLLQEHSWKAGRSSCTGLMAADQQAKMCMRGHSRQKSAVQAVMPRPSLVPLLERPRVACFCRWHCEAVRCGCFYAGSAPLGSKIVKKVLIQNMRRQPLGLVSRPLDPFGPFCLDRAMRPAPAKGSSAITLSFSPQV